MTVNFLIASVFFHSYHDHQSFHSFPTRRSSDLFSPLEALQAATLNPAIYFHKRAEFGTVEVGKAADLVFLEGNPLQDIHNTQQIAAVVTAGRYLDREKIHRLLSEADGLARKGE